jgi:SAM-dependent methyltransferase
VTEFEAKTYVDKTRIAYDVVAADYHDLLKAELDKSVWDRAMLGAFAEVVDGPVVDVGCGPGRITGYLAGLGLDVSGIDLSPGMVAVARQQHPGIGFVVGSMLELALPDSGVGGVVAWYSLVHTPEGLLPAAFEEFLRVLRPGGHLLLAFKVGDEKRSLTQGYGHAIDLDVYWYEPAMIVDRLTEAGFVEVARLVRAAEGPERQPQAYVMAAKPMGVGGAAG